MFGEIHIEGSCYPRGAVNRVDRALGTDDGFNAKVGDGVNRAIGLDDRAPTHERDATGKGFVAQGVRAAATPVDIGAARAEQEVVAAAAGNGVVAAAAIEAVGLVVANNHIIVFRAIDIAEVDDRQLGAANPGESGNFKGIGGEIHVDGSSCAAAAVDRVDALGIALDHFNIKGGDGVNTHAPGFCDHPAPGEGDIGIQS